jgi:diguanylate cyclase (GGDEF)-like protein
VRDLLQKYRLTRLGFGASLRTRILLGTLLPVAAILSYFFYTYYATRELALQTHEILDTRIEMMHAAERVKQAMVAYDDALFRYLTLHDPAQLREGKFWKTIAKKDVDELHSLATSPILKDRLEFLSTESSQFFTDAERLLEYATHTRTPVENLQQRSTGWVRTLDDSHLELAFLSAEGRARLVRIFGLCDELITVNRIELDRAQQDMNAALQHARRAAFFLSVLSIVILCLIALGFVVSILYPLDDLMNGIRQIEQGDLNIEIPAASSDEVGELARAFNRATRTIRQQREQLLQETITDSLTGVYNQRYFRKLLKQEIERARRSGETLSLMMIDVDHFKRYNDTWGHEFGNDVLKRVCEALKRTLRETDLLTRYGGDEFAVLLPNTEAGQAHALANRLVEGVANLEPVPFPLQDERIALTISIGGACYPTDAQTGESLIQKADQGLYAAKQAGRARAAWVSRSI